MRIVFDHLAGCGRISDGDFIHAPAHIEGVTHEDAARLVEEGWAINEWETPLQLYQARQVRIASWCRDFPLPDGVEWMVNHTPRGDEYVDVYEAYRAKHGYSDHLSIHDTISKIDEEMKVAVEFWKGSDMVAFTLIRTKPYFASLQFCWDYAEPELRLGYLSQKIEQLLAHEYGYAHAYIGPGYGRISKYKASAKGFEFWTGSVWSSDREIYLSLCERDDELKSIKDIMDATASA